MQIQATESGLSVRDTGSWEGNVGGRVKGRIGREGMVVMFYANIVSMHEFLNKITKE